jgi:hypothetical protein
VNLVCVLAPVHPVHVACYNCYNIRCLRNLCKRKTLWWWLLLSGPQTHTHTISRINSTNGLIHPRAVQTVHSILLWTFLTKQIIGRITILVTVVVVQQFHERLGLLLQRAQTLASHLFSLGTKCLTGRGRRWISSLFLGVVPQFGRKRGIATAPSSRGLALIWIAQTVTAAKQRLFGGFHTRKSCPNETAFGRLGSETVVAAVADTARIGVAAVVAHAVTTPAIVIAGRFQLQVRLGVGRVLKETSHHGQAAAAVVLAHFQVALVRLLERRGRVQLLLVPRQTE